MLAINKIHYSKLIAHLFNLHRAIHNLIRNLSILPITHIHRADKGKVRHVAKIAKHLIRQKMERLRHGVIPLPNLEFEVSSIYDHIPHSAELVSPLGNCSLKKLMLWSGW